VVARAEGLAKAYGEIVVFRSLDLALRRGDRLALVGPNGAGKSTLLKLLAGKSLPDGGHLELGHSVEVSYFAQHQLEALDARRTVLEEMELEADAATRPRLRTLLGSFLFSGDDVEKKVGVLSGGEKTRLALAKMLLHRTNLLLLDEPTNHLDLRSREVLENALDEYAGTLVAISHDRYFINRVATSIGEIGRGTIEVYPGDYDTYLERSAARETVGARAAVRPNEPSIASRGRDARRNEAEARNRRYQERRAAEDRLRPLETEIAALEERARELQGMQTDPGIYGDAGKAQEVGREKTRVDARLEELYAEWERLAME
jgi:ATP-binding cassette subfamily F protein 3